MAVREGPIEWHELGQYSDIPMFNTKAVVQQTHVTAPTLRAWERRYTLLSPERAANDYRLYSERDIVMIRWLKERVDEGMAISQAIVLFRHLSEVYSQPQEHQETQENIQARNTLACSPPAFQVATPAKQPKGKGTSKDDRDQPSIRNWLELGTEATQSKYPATHSMRIMREHLLEAFNLLDEPMASMMMSSMLAIYPVEQVCTELITPTMWQVGQLWADSHLTVPVEHFASNFFRASLTNLFHVTPSPNSGPLAIVCCAPGEQHELAPLMLSLFLRRSGVRVVYLGQSIETAGLMQTIRKLAPSLVCISLTMADHLSALIDLGQQIRDMQFQRPIFAFGGQLFVHYANAIPQVPGIYLDGDLKTVVAQLRSMVLERPENRN